MFSKTAYNPYKCDILLSKNQNKFLVNQVITQLQKFYTGNDDRKMVLNAFTGSGKTTVSIKSLIPEFISNFYVSGKRVIGFMAPRKEVVDKAYRTAKKNLHNKTVGDARVKVYSSDDIDRIKKNLKKGNEKESLDGDAILLFITSQYFYNNYDLLTEDGTFDMMIVDEAHIMFGTISKEDTKADKGVTNNNFVAETLTKLRELTDCAVLFLSATPTKSQRELTELGAENNIYLDPMPRDILTTPFYDIVTYLDNEDTLIKGLRHFKNRCDVIADLLTHIDNNTWNVSKKHFFPTYPALMARIGRRGAKNGVDFNEYINEIRNICNTNGFTLFISTSRGKEFDNMRIDSLDAGVQLGDKHNHKPIVMITIDSGYAGVDFVKITDVIIGRDPKGTIHNNYSQTAGRAARMKFGFINHADAADEIRDYDITDAQKRLLAEYYINHSTSVVHVPVQSKLLNGDVKEFIKTDTYRGNEGKEFILNRVFDNNPPELRLKVSTSIENNGYQRYKKTYCECCEVTGLNTDKTDCYWTTFRAFKIAFGYDKFSIKEMDILWPLCLHVHHKDGNHFNNDVSNLITVCPNIHALVTMHNEDYKNRYPELREALAKLANAKSVILPKTIALV